MMAFIPELSLFRRQFGTLFDELERGIGMGIFQQPPLDVDYLPLTDDKTNAEGQGQGQGQQDNTAGKGEGTEMKRGESGGEGRQTSGSTAMTQPARQQSLMRGSPFGSLIRSVSDIGIRLDVQEDENNMNIVAELPPSVKKDDVNINVRGNVLSITAEKRNERKEEDKEKKYLLQEISYGSASRTIRLPNYVDMNKLQAKFDDKDGKLRITIPKREESKNTEKKVEIQ